MALKQFIQILRPVNCIIAAIGAFIGFCLATNAIAFNLTVLIAMISVFLICGAGQTVNDFFDIEIDRRANKKKILVQGFIKPKTAFNYAFALFAIGIIFSVFINLTALAIAIIFSLLLFCYAALFNKFKYLGNWIVALGTAFTLIFGASIIGNFALALTLAFAALLVNVAREIIKDAEDIKADTGMKKTLPQIISMRTIKILVAIFYIGAIIIGFIPLMQEALTNAFYISLMALASVLLAVSFAYLFSNKLHSAQNFSKAGMFFGLISFLFGLI